MGGQFTRSYGARLSKLNDVLANNTKKILAACACMLHFHAKIGSTDLDEIFTYVVSAISGITH